MTRTIKRREFLKKSLGAGLTAAVGAPLLGRFAVHPLFGLAKEAPDVAVAAGAD